MKFHHYTPRIGLMATLLLSTCGSTVCKTASTFVLNPAFVEWQLYRRRQKSRLRLRLYGPYPTLPGRPSLRVAQEASAHVERGALCPAHRGRRSDWPAAAGIERFLTTPRCNGYGKISVPFRFNSSINRLWIPRASLPVKPSRWHRGHRKASDCCDRRSLPTREEHGCLAVSGKTTERGCPPDWSNL
jgi:hypothetical protein